MPGGHATMNGIVAIAAEHPGDNQPGGQCNLEGKTARLSGNHEWNSNQTDRTSSWVKRRESRIICLNQVI